MAKRATNGEPTKTQLIQDFYKQGITSGKDILAKMEEAGQPSTKSMVYTTISNLKRDNGGKKGKQGGRKVSPPVTNGEMNEVAISNGVTGKVTLNGAGSVTLEDLSTIAQLAKRVGGVEKLKAVVGALAGIS